MADDKSQAVVTMEVTDGVALLRLDNPPLNVLSRRVYRELERHLDAIQESRDVRVVVLASTGTRAFCAGADIKEFSGYTTAEAAREQGEMIHRVSMKVADLRQPIIAAVEAVALGGGCELVLYCDLRIAGENARIGLPEVKVGQFPGTGGTEWLPRLVGEVWAKEMMFTGEAVSASEAYRIGLVNRVVPASEAESTALELASVIASRPAVAVQAIKESIRRGRGITPEAHRAVQVELMQRVFQSEDAVEGYTAFFEKRPPSFKHR